MLLQYNMHSLLNARLVHHTRALFWNNVFLLLIQTIKKYILKTSHRIDRFTVPER